MKRKFATFMVMLLAFALLISTTAITVSAETTTYAPIGGSTTLVKNLVVDSDANIPNLTFTYSIKRGTAVAATSSTIGILVSEIGGGTIGTAEFSNDDTPNTIPGLPTDADPTNPTAGKKYAQKEVAVTFSSDSFTKPGVYRYEITEKVPNPPLPGVVYDSPKRCLDVFVVADDNNVLSVAGYVLRDTATNIGKDDGKYVENPDVKSAGYTNSITQYDFDFSKIISGNQGDKNKKFLFTLHIEGANPGVYPITTTDVTDNPTSITVPDGGEATATYRLTNGSSVKIFGLNAGAVCTVTEVAEDYTPTYSLDGADAVSGNSSGKITLANSNHSVAFTNTRNGIIPTGIIMTIAPFAVGILVFGGVIAFIIYKRKKRLIKQ